MAGAKNVMMMTPSVPGNERADRRDTERWPGPALSRHLVAVKTGHDGCGFTGMFRRMDVVEPPYIAP
jgi:hypothetical protein